MNVTVIGAGWAGLAAAVELSRRGAAVTVLEAARQLGGRARGLRFDTCHVDNGQHLLLGAYRTVLGLLDTIGVREPDVFTRLPLNLTLFEAGEVSFSLSAPRLPAPLHAGWALMRARGLSFEEKRLAARVITAARDGVVEDIPVAQFLVSVGQGKRAVERLWEPLCLAALNTPIDQASTQLFLNVLRATFLAPRSASDMLVPRVDLGQCLPEPARDFIERHNGSVRLGERVNAIQVAADGSPAVISTREVLFSDAVVIAAGARAAAELLRPHPLQDGVARRIDRLGSAPICTLYLRYPHTVRLPQPFVGLLGGMAQWLFDLGQLGRERGVIAAVVSGPGEHMRMDAAQLTQRMVGDIARQMRNWPAPLSTKLVREKQATFLATAGCETQRPGNATPMPRFWLAGDYTATGYPGTLEGAVMSGVQCARLVLAEDSGHERLSAAS